MTEGMDIVALGKPRVFKKSLDRLWTQDGDLQNAK